MKTIWKLTALLTLLFLLLPLQVRAASMRIIDEAGLFDLDETEELEARAEEISQKYGIDVFILTSYDSGFSDNYARDVTEEYGVKAYPGGYIGYGVNMADRSYWVDAYGDETRRLFSQSRTDSMAEKAYDDLADGEYADSARGFLEDVDRRYAVAVSKYGPLSKLWIYKGRTILLSILSLVLAAAGALFWTWMKVRRHHDKSVSVEADAYKQPLTLSGQYDQFVRSYQTRVRRQESSSHGGGGGGGSCGHTGSGGHF